MSLPQFLFQTLRNIIFLKCHPCDIVPIKITNTVVDDIVNSYFSFTFVYNILHSLFLLLWCPGLHSIFHEHISMSLCNFRTFSFIFSSVLLLVIFSFWNFFSLKSSFWVLREKLDITFWLNISRLHFKLPYAEINILCTSSSHLCHFNKSNIFHFFQKQWHISQNNLDFLFPMENSRIW